MPIVGYRKMWLKIAKLGGLPAEITPHGLRHSFASSAADLGYNEPTIATLLDHKTHSLTRRYMHSADEVLLAAAVAGECHQEADGAGRDRYRPDTNSRATSRSLWLRIGRGGLTPPAWESGTDEVMLAGVLCHSRRHCWKAMLTGPAGQVGQRLGQPASCA
jgi:hypothetical protein